MSALFDFQRVNRRMHNKSFTADGSPPSWAAGMWPPITFAVGDESHFADFDVLAAGPVAGEVAEMFDRYWYSVSAIPIAALIKKRLSPEQLAEQYAGLTARAEAVTQAPDFQPLAGNQVGAENPPSRAGPGLGTNAARL